MLAKLPSPSGAQRRHQLTCGCGSKMLKTRQLILKGCVRGRKEEGHPRPAAGSALRFYPSSSLLRLPHGSKSLELVSGWHTQEHQQDGQAAQGQTDGHLLPQSPPQEGHAVMRSSATAPCTRQEDVKPDAQTVPNWSAELEQTTR